ncbi:MAG: C-GCAxxG-C-C family protein [Phascolarctobacterium sp.]|nr:C-GCAxxG-C-C family protein [Phascolarctobacterium sp.]
MALEMTLTDEEKVSLKKAANYYFVKKLLNCGLTMMHCLSDFFNVPVHEQVYQAINGIMENRFKRYQCGLYKGTVMFLGIYGTDKGWDRDKLNAITLDFAKAFEKEYGSIMCNEVRRVSFETNSAHLICTAFAARAVIFSANYIKNLK